MAIGDLFPNKPSLKSSENPPYPTFLEIGKQIFVSACNVHSFTAASNWACSKFSSSFFPYAQRMKNNMQNNVQTVKNSIASVHSIASNLYNPNPIVAEKIKSNLPTVNLTQLILPEPGKNNSLKLKILSVIEEVILPVDEKRMLSKCISKPTVPSLTNNMVAKVDVLIKGQKTEIENRKNQYENQTFLSKVTNFIPYLIEQGKAENNLDTLERKHKEVSIPGALEQESGLSKGREALHSLAKILLNQLSVDKNFGNLISFVLKELTSIITSIQDIELLNSTSINEDFIKEKTGRINVNANDFDEEIKLKLIKNLESLLNNTINKKLKSNEINFILSNIGQTFSNLLLKVASSSSTPSIEKIIDKLCQLFLDETAGLLLNMVKKIPYFQSSGNLGDDIFNLYQGLLKEGVQLDSINICFPDAMHLERDQFDHLIKNVQPLIPLIFTILIEVVLEGLTSYTDWEADRSAPPTNADDKDKKRMQKNVNKNFINLVDTIQAGIDKTLTGILGERLEFYKNKGELQDKSNFGGFIASAVCFLCVSRCFLFTTGNIQLIFEHLAALLLMKTFPVIEKAVLSKAARGAIFTAENLVSNEIKKIDIAQLIPIFTEYLGKIANT